MKKLIIAVALLGFISKGTAQVKFQLSLMADKKTYIVSMIPTETWVYPKNMTSTAQVTLRVPSSARFTAGSITSLQAGVRWLDNAYVERPAADPNYNYVSFALLTLGTGNIPYRAGVETPLFSFRNIQNECVGKIELVDNSSHKIAEITAAGFNVKNHIATLASKGKSAFSGTINTIADCSATTNILESNNIVNTLAAYPIPAAHILTIEWSNNMKEVAQSLSLVVVDVLGKEVFTEKLDPLSKNGQLQKFDLNVSAWSEGLYMFRFVSEKGTSEMSKFIVNR